MSNQERPSLTRYDDLEHYRCPLLGDAIHFSYCRKMNEGLPCRKLFDCWVDKINVEGYLNENFTPDEIHKAIARPQPGRIETMFEVLNRALEEKKRQQKNDES
ncbi:MAG: hypothetical protein JXR73_14455 [Candidatus Omnitrophica bacterium]|nr:hypothetical protein [Candidatus Omnitrophota bacterium]